MWFVAFVPRILERDCSSADDLHVDSLFRMTHEIPAGWIAQMRKQRVNAALIDRIGGEILDLSVLQGNSIITPHRHGSECISAGVNSDFEYGVINDVTNENDADEPQHADCDETLPHIRANTNSTKATRLCDLRVIPVATFPYWDFPLPAELSEGSANFESAIGCC